MSQLRPRQEFTQAATLNLQTADDIVQVASAQESSHGAQINPKKEFDAPPFAEISSPVLDPLVAPLQPQPKDRRSKLAGAAMLTLLGLLCTELALGLYQTWHHSLPLFTLYFSAFSLSLAWLLRAIWRESRLLNSLTERNEMQQQTIRLRQSMQQGEALPLIEQIAKQLPAAQQAAYHSFCQLNHQQHNDAEICLLFEQQVLQQLDQQAQTIVHRYATEAAIMLAASPLAVLDMALMLWRNQKMIQELSQHYGIQLGYWSRVKLFKTVLMNVLYGGVTELAIDLSGQALSLDFTSKVSASLAQGLGAGLLTARLGYQAMAVCRPFSFTEESRPKLTKIHQVLLGALKQFAFGSADNTAAEKKPASGN